MHILICHERFLFRFGADRVLLLLARGLRTIGHRVTLIANRFDPLTARGAASRVIGIPESDSEYRRLDESNAAWLGANWRVLFEDQGQPDIAVVGGWPFYASIPVLAANGCRVVFSDHGVVPDDGYPEETREILGELRRLRRRYLRECSLVIPVSEFIARTQSVPDSAGEVPVHPIWNGVDHLATPLWNAGEAGAVDCGNSGVELVRRYKADRRPIIFGLGRWEPSTYKNSQAAFDVLRFTRRSHPSATLALLGAPRSVAIPPDLTESVVTLGFPSDEKLVEIMRLADVGISVSLWEGFNLPFAEMQWLGRPCLAFNLAAHPEVAALPWNLCADVNEMAHKTSAILSGGGPSVETVAAKYEAFRRRFSWLNAIQCYQRLFDSLIEGGRTSERIISKSVIVDVTNSTRDVANSGVIRVTRRMGQTLQAMIEPIFVVWDQSRKRYVLPTRDEFERLSNFNGPTLAHEEYLSGDHDSRLELDQVRKTMGGYWLLLPEMRSEIEYAQIREYCRQREIRIAAVFYDSIPMIRPDLCSEVIRGGHRAYMLGLAECDVVFPISQFSTSCLLDFWKSADAAGTRVTTIQLPGEFGGTGRQFELPSPPTTTVQLLCVSTLEPRKNHRCLIEAFQILEADHPEVEWRLTLVGNQYAGADDLAEFVRQAAASNPNLHWLGIVDDPTLVDLYREAHLSVYPSLIEGFGLPILESIWHCRPCVCSSDGVMAELAREGGCLTTDVSNAAALADAVYRLATDRDLYRRLSNQAAERSLKTWSDYTSQVLAALKIAPSWRGGEDSHEKPELPDGGVGREDEIQVIQAVLARWRPRCSLYIGREQGVELALLSRYSKSVISVSAGIEHNPLYEELSNVSTIAAPAQSVLPTLFEEAAGNGLPVDFVLIDAGFPPEDLRSQLAILLSLAPRTPLILLLKHGFNPDCRRVIIETDWDQSPWCHGVDLNVLPVMESASSSEAAGCYCGGLSIASFAPDRRAGVSDIRRPADGVAH